MGHPLTYKYCYIDTDVCSLSLHISMQSIQNLGLAIISIAAGAILDSKGYLVLEVFFCACICGQYFYVFLFPFFFQSLVRHLWVPLLVMSFLHWFSFYFPVVGLLAAVLLYFVDYIKGEKRLECWILPLFHSSLFCVSLLSPIFFISLLIWHLFTLLSHSFPYHQIHSLLNLPISFSCSRRRFEPVSRSQSQTQ